MQITEDIKILKTVDHGGRRKLDWTGMEIKYMTVPCCIVLTLVCEYYT